MIMYKKDLFGFLKKYFPHIFSRQFTPYAADAVCALEHVLIDGGYNSCCLGRGEGATSILYCGAIWAILNGHRKYIIQVSRWDRLATSIPFYIADELAANGKLIADYPYVTEIIESRGWVSSHKINFLGRGVVESYGVESFEGCGLVQTIDGVRVRPDCILQDGGFDDLSPHVYDRFSDRLRSFHAWNNQPCQADFRFCNS